MAREVKILKDKNGNDVEVYADVCNVCQKEMVFPKKQADQIEEMFPFIKAKVDKGSPCLECAKEQMANGTFNIYTPDEINQIKVKAEQAKAAGKSSMLDE